MWQRTQGWATSPIRPIDVPPAPLVPWTEVSSPQGRELRLSIPWGTPVEGGIELARSLSVEVILKGTGSAPLDASILRRIANPAGGSRFGIPSTRSAPRGLSSKAELVPDGSQILILTVSSPTPGDLSQDGWVRLTGAQIRSVLGSLNGIDISRVAVASGARGPIARGVARERAPIGPEPIPVRRVDRRGNGSLDDDDAIEFFVHGTSHWQDDSLLFPGAFSLSVHPWDVRRRYLVRLDAPSPSPDLPMGEAPSSPTRVDSTFRPVWAGMHKELRVQEIGLNSFDHESGTSWMWHWVENSKLSASQLDHPASRDLPGLRGTSGITTVRLAMDSPDGSDTLKANGTPSVFLGSRESEAAWQTDNLRGTGNSWSWRTNSDAVGFESYTVHYPFQPSRNLPLPFPAPGLGSFSLAVSSGTASDSFVVTEDGIARRIVVLKNGRLEDSARIRNTWYHPMAKSAVTSLSKWTPPTGKRVLAPSRWGESMKIDMIVVAPDSFLDLATTYADFRSDARRIRPLETMVVRSSDLWSQFGGGSQDPLAMREILRWGRERWGTTHALILGGGHFDPRGITGSHPAPLPIWEDQQVATDAILTFLDPGEMAQPGNKSQDIALGRVPARSREEVSAWFEKVRRWEDPDLALTGPWRNTFLSTADDMTVRANGGSNDPIYGVNGYSGHTNSAERLVDAALGVRPWLNLRKVYEVEYPLNSVLEKPDAQRALLDQLNRGVAVMMYMGHGGYDILADERLLDTRSAVLGLSNTQTPFLLYAGSCTVGRHDLSPLRGLSETLVITRDKGAVASIAGTRPSFPDDNERLASNFWKLVFCTAPGGQPRTLGEAFQDAQNSFNSSASDRQSLYPNSSIYNLLGDPGMVPFPAGSPLTLETPIDTLAALDTRLLQGKGDDQLRINLVSRPTPQTATFPYGGKTYVQNYKSPGRSILSLGARSTNGRYQAHMLTPARIPFGDTVLLHLYGWNPHTLRDSAVVDSQVVLAGVGDHPPEDNQGPAIRILPCDSSWTGGVPYGKSAEIPLPFCLNVFLNDSSGISASDSPDDGVILSFPGLLEPWHPTDLQEGRNFSEAIARFSLDTKTFEPGKSYQFKVFARDLMGNASSASLELHTRQEGDIGLYEVFNRPNPVKGKQTTFYFKLLADADSNGTVPQTIQASVRIHTLSGKLVRILQTNLTDVGHPRPRAVWDLQDSFRNEVANGLYPYTVKLRVQDPNSHNWRQIEKRGVIAVSR